MPDPARRPAARFRDPARARAVATLVFVGAACLLGGSSVAVLPAAAVQLAAAVLLALLLADRWREGHDPRAVPALVLAVLIVATPVLQSVPLPPALWHGLAGRAVPDAVRAAIGADARWFPLSLDRDATRAAGLMLLVGVTAFLATLRADYRLRYHMIRLVVAIAVLGLLLGVLQVASRGAPLFLPYATPHAGALLGVFANRNHQADMLLIAALLWAAMVRWDPTGRFTRASRGVVLSLSLLLLVGVVVTTSRMGLLLVPVAMAGIALLAVRSPGRVPRGVLVALPLVMLAAAVLATRNPVVAATLARFSSGPGDLRFQFWPDVVYAVRAAWPWGTGLGTFVPVYGSVEQLDLMTRLYINHAHNDYLEIALEAGLWGVLLVAAGLLLLARMAVARLSGPRGGGDPAATAAVFGLAILLLHALVDYPLRTPALMAVFGMLAGLLFAPGGDSVRPAARA